MYQKDNNNNNINNKMLSNDITPLQEGWYTAVLSDQRKKS